MTTSPFDLPDRLHAKADPALIREDERHLAAIAASIDRTVDEVTARLAVLRRAGGGEGQEPMDRRPIPKPGHGPNHKRPRLAPRKIAKNSVG